MKSSVINPTTYSWFKWEKSEHSLESVARVVAEHPEIILIDGVEHIKFRGRQTSHVLLVTSRLLWELAMRSPETALTLWMPSFCILSAYLELTDITSCWSCQALGMPRSSSVKFIFSCRVSTWWRLERRSIKDSVEDFSILSVNTI